METKEIATIEKNAVNAVDNANALIIGNQKDYDGCANMLRAIKGLKKEIDNSFDESIKKAHETHKTMVGAKKAHYAPLDEAEKIIKGKSLVWYNEEQRKQREEQRKIDEQAKKAEDKRKAVLEAQAKQHEANGNADKAEERRSMAEEVFVPAPIVEERATKAEGQAVVTRWSAKVTDLFALCNAIAKGDLPETCVKPDMSQLNALARTWKGSKKFEGVKFVPEQSLSVRS